jgi:hypothetical protein
MLEAADIVAGPIDEKGLLQNRNLLLLKDVKIVIVIDKPIITWKKSASSDKRFRRCGN